MTTHVSNCSFRRLLGILTQAWVREERRVKFRQHKLYFGIKESTNVLGEELVNIVCI